MSGSFRRVAAAIAVWAAVAWSPNANAIVNGDDAEAGDAPWQVQFERMEDGGRMASNVTDRHLCGGVLINRSWVITARHCLEDRQPGDPSDILNHIRMRLGHTDLRETEALKEETGRAVLHGGYVPSNTASPAQNDIALVRLKEPVEKVDGVVEFAQLPKRGASLPADVMVFGWGSTKTFHTRDYLAGIMQEIETSAVLQKASMHGMATEDCESTYKEKLNQNDFALPDGTACIVSDDYEKTGDNASVCQGDSGGAVMDGHTLVGIVSWVAGCHGRPAVVTDIAQFADWINDTISKDDAQGSDSDQAPENRDGEPKPEGAAR